MPFEARTGVLTDGAVGNSSSSTAGRAAAPIRGRTGSTRTSMVPVVARGWVGWSTNVPQGILESGATGSSFVSSTTASDGIARAGTKSMAGSRTSSCRVPSQALTSHGNSGATGGSGGVWAGAESTTGTCSSGVATISASTGSASISRVSTSTTSIATGSARVSAGSATIGVG